MKEFLMVAITLGFFFFISKGIKEGVLFTVFSNYFPLWLKVGGRDAFTLTTLFIYFIFIIVILSRRYQIINFFRNTNKTIVALLLLSTLISIICYSKLSADDIMAQLRFLAGYLGAILIFVLITFIIKNLKDWCLLVKVIAIALAVNSVFSIFILKNIGMPFFDMFLIQYGNEPITLIFHDEFGDDYIRPAGVISDYELFPEMILMLFPLLYFIITGLNTIKKKIFHYIILIVLIMGIGLSITRGAILILCAQVIFLTLLNPAFSFQKKILSFSLVLFLLGAACSLAILLKIDVFNTLSQRFELINDSFAQHQDFVSTINRDDRVADFKKNTLLYFGYAKLSDETGSFHSLLLTHLYKDGYIGTLFFFLFYYSILFYSISNFFTNKDRTLKYFFFLVSLSILSFLLNEIKVEYLRYSYTIQAFFIVLPLYFTFHQIYLDKKHDEAENTLDLPG